MLRVAFVCACGALWLVAARIMTCCPGCACQRRAGPDVADVEISMRHPALVRVLRRRFFRRLFRVDQIYLQLVRGSWRTYPPPPRAPVLIAWARERYGTLPFVRPSRRGRDVRAATRSRRRRRSPTTVRGPYRYRKTEPDRTTAEISGGFGSVRLFGWTSPGRL